MTQISPQTNNPSERLQEPDLLILLNRFKRFVKNELNCVSIGVIQSFDVNNQTATIALNYMRVIKGGTPVGVNQSSNTTVNYPLLINCPVFVLNGGGGVLTFPIAKNDTCIVLFADREIDTWFTTGGVNPPAGDRVHDLNDAIALIGIRSLEDLIADYSADAVQLKYKDALIEIDVSGNININSAGEININADSDVNITSAGNINIAATTQVAINP